MRALPLKSYGFDAGPRFHVLVQVVHRFVLCLLKLLFIGDILFVFLVGRGILRGCARRHGSVILYKPVTIEVLHLTGELQFGTGQSRIN